ncbi:hypothetical protein CMV_000987 [Castanea mollissima]|uniref:X8 domain-containing protein n=1 Tax=Castanea mollissima TaxID=60419 RepID=A0A8J4VX98_9ROSI|nr:hypothetical protein CMV_000987 [Castanea mollissima]
MHIESLSSCSSFWRTMSSAFIRTLLALLLLTLILQKSDGQFEEWCIADEQTPDDELLKALNWACGKGGADCSKIQKFKHIGATCYFNAAAMITDLDPSHKSCKFEYLP